MGWIGNAARSLSQSLVLVTLEPADGDVTLGQYQVPGEDECHRTRTFTFENVKPGRYVLARHCLPQMASADTRLVGATWNGRDIIGTPLEVSGR